MQIVINISGNKYKYIKRLDDDITDYQTSLLLYKAVKNGTPIPDNLCDVIEPSKIKRMQELLDESYAKGFADGKEGRRYNNAKHMDN